MKCDIKLVFNFDMEIEVKGNLRVKINQEDKTASVVKSLKATGDVFYSTFCRA